MAEELKACPFCGGSAAHVEYDKAQPFEPFGLIVDHKEGCFLDYKRGFDNAIPAWNRRHPLPEQAHDGSDQAMLERAALQLEVERLRNQIATYEVLIGNDLIGTISKCLDDAGAPKWSSDRKIMFSVFDRIRALAADTARLDFLDRCNERLNAQCGTTYHWTLIMNHNVNRLMLGHMAVDLHDSAAPSQGLPSCRAAIDAEMERIREAQQP